MPLHSFLQTCLRFESFDVKTPRWAFDRTGWLFGPSSVFPLSLSVGCFAFLFASHFALTYISVFWIGDDFRSISLCLALSHHLTICPVFLLIYAWRCSCSHLIAHLLKKYLSSPLNHTISSTICTCWLWKKKRKNSHFYFDFHPFFYLGHLKCPRISMCLNDNFIFIFHYMKMWKQNTIITTQTRAQSVELIDSLQIFQMLLPSVLHLYILKIKYIK